MISFQIYSVALSQVEGPIQLNTEKVQEQLRHHLNKELSLSSEMLPAKEPSSSMARKDMEEGSVRVRETRVRVKPKWLQEFVKMETR